MEYPLTIFYDGACGVCSREMAHYMSIADQKVHFVNIAADDFNAHDYGKSDDDFQRELHVCDNRGDFYTGVAAFRKLWEALPSPFYPLLSFCTGLPLVHFSARCGYALFSRYRYLFSGKAKNTCPLE